MRRYGVGLAVLFVLAGCSSAGDGDRPPPALREAWRVGGFTPIGQPVAVGEMAVGYGSVDRDLLLFGVSVADGTVRWRQPASPSRTTSGISLAPDVIGGRVAYFRPDNSANLAARLVVASPDTGADLLVSEPAQFASTPSACPGSTDVCVTTHDGNRTVSRRYSVEARGLVADRSAAPEGSRYLGEDLLDLGQREPELFASFRDGAVQWRSPLGRHFSHGHSTDEGWHFELFRSAGLHVGSVGSYADGDATKGGVDLSKVEMAAIRAGDGSPAWRAQQTSFLCNSKVRLRHDVAGGTEVWPVRCRMRGILHYDRATQVATYDGLDVTIEGFDISTGATTWAVPLGAAEVFMQDERRVTAVSDREVLVQGAGGPLIVDLSSGASRPAALADTFWCAKGAWFHYREAKQFADGSTLDRWRGETLLYACAGDGSPAATLPRSIAPSLGAKVGERTVLATAEGLVAYDPPVAAPA